MTKADMLAYWRSASDSDLGMAELAHLNGRNTHALFFLHLATEKALKGVLVLQGKDVQYEHNLAHLAEEVGNEHFSLEQRQMLADMTAFNIKGRYDDYKQTFAQLATDVYTEGWLAKGKAFLLWLQQHFH